jgi:hypothetical protein
LNKRLKKLEVSVVDTSYVSLSIRKIVLLIPKSFFCDSIEKKVKSGLCLRVLLTDDADRAESVAITQYIFRQIFPIVVL